MSMKTLSENGLNLIKQFEGCRLEAYLDAVGVWTIGYGHIRGVTKGQRISQSQADNLLKGDVARYESNVNSFDYKYNWTQNEFDALVSFAFNIGNINQLTQNGSRSKDQIAEKFTAYNKAGGRVLPGLTKRREAEKALFLKKDDSSTTNNTISVEPKADKNPYKEPTRTVTSKENAKANGIKSYVSVGDAVKWVQWELKNKGYDIGKDGIDGDCGKNTIAAIKKFQTDKALEVDGIVGKLTRAVLKK